MPEVLERTLFGNAYWDWALACLTALVSAGALLMARRSAGRSQMRFASAERIELMHVPLQVLSRTGVAFVITLAVFLGTSLLELPAKVERVAWTVLTVVFFWQLGVWATTALTVYLDRKRVSALSTDRAAVGSIGIIGFVGRVLVWAVVAMMVLDNVGVDVTALVAGLGVGGIAVALAVQNVLGDLFASLSIALDRPFVVGDFLVVGDYLGTVEYIGIKSVRLRSLSGEQIVIANADLLGSRVRNYGRMAERRVVFSIRVTYETPRAHLQRIPETIREIVTAQSDVRFERSHFARLGEFAFEFESVYYVLSADYNRYMDIQQAINLALHEAFERDGIEFAYPARKLWLRSLGGPAPAALHDDTSDAGDGAQARKH